MFIQKWLLTGCLMVLGCNVAWAEPLRVAATVPNMGMLVREIGADRVLVHVMAPPNRDAHFLEARPSMMRHLRRAELVVSVGADLEIGWLPAAIRGANNRRVQQGQLGYFAAADFVTLLEAGQKADRAMGDVHPVGNPHVDFCPARMTNVADALAERLGALRPQYAEEFKDRANAFRERADSFMLAWRQRLSDTLGVLAYHSDYSYLLDSFEIPRHGTIEPLPGIPPTASHLRSLMHRLRDQEGIIWITNFQPSRPANRLAGELGWKVAQQPVQVGLEATVDDYFEMIDQWLQTLVVP